MSAETLDIVATHVGVRAMGGWLQRTLDEKFAPFAPRRGELELALHEVIVNVIDHAYLGGDEAKRCRLSLEMAERQLVATCVDHGVAFAPPEVPRELGGEPMVRGYGLLIVEQLASSVTYTRVGECNQWRVVFDPETAPHG